MLPGDSLVTATNIAEVKDLSNYINYIIGLVTLSVIAPFLHWLGSKFKDDPNSKRLEKLENMLATLVEIQKDYKNYLDHIHNDVSKIRDEDRNITRDQVIPIAHYFINGYATHLRQYVEEVEAVNNILGNWDNVATNMLKEHLKVYDKMRSMFRHLEYHDRPMSAFMDDSVRDMMQQMATYVMKNLAAIARGDDPAEKSWVDYYENWRSKFMSMFIVFIDTTKDFKSQMAGEVNWDMGNIGGGEVEFLIPQKPEIDDDVPRFKSGKRKL